MSKKTLTVKEWADEDKPREKMLSHGKKQLSNVELVAILLRNGLQGKSVLELAREVLDSAGNSLTTLSKMDYKQLSCRKGMAKAKVTTLMAALELGWRMQSEIDNEKLTVIDSSDKLFKYFLSTTIDLDHEEFWAVYLNNHNKVLGRQRISMGGLTETTVDVRILLRGALEYKATALAVMHNHPTGVTKPSTQDRALTRKLMEACKIMDLQLKDHIIVGLAPDGHADYYSFHDNGLV